MDRLEIGTRVLVLGGVQKPGSIIRLDRTPVYHVRVHAQDLITGLTVPGTMEFANVKESEMLRGVCPCGKYEDLNSQKSTTFKCGKCKKARFCSKTCQRQAWPEHKKQCEQMALGPARGEHQFLVGEHLLLVNVQQQTSCAVTVTATSYKPLYTVKMDHMDNKACQCGPDQLRLL